MRIPLPGLFTDIIENCVCGLCGIGAPKNNPVWFWVWLGVVHAVDTVIVSIGRIRMKCWITCAIEN